MLIVIIWLVLALVIGFAAGQRGRSGVGWFFLAVVLSPLIAGLLVAVLPDLHVRDMLADLHDSGAVNDRELRRNVRAGGA